MVFGFLKSKSKKDTDLFSDLENLKNQVGGSNPFGDDTMSSQQPSQQFNDLNNIFGNNQQFGGLQMGVGQQFQQLPQQNQQMYQQPYFSQQVKQLPPQQEQMPQEIVSVKKLKEKPKKKMREIREEVKKELLVKVEDYKKVRDLLLQLKDKLSEVESTLTEVKESENKKLEELKSLKEKLEVSKKSVNDILEIFR